MENIFKDIKKAQGAGACYSALALALTIPDVCSQAEGIPYWDWFDKWAKNNDYFNGSHCYALRCAFLHSLNANIEEQTGAFKHTGDEEKKLIFEIMITDPNKVSISLMLEDTEKKEKIIKLNANQLIDLLLTGYRKFSNQNPKLVIENKNIIYIDQ